MNAIAVIKAGPLADFARPLSARLRALNPHLPVFVLDPAAQPQIDNPEWAKAWLWDLLPENVNRVLCCDPDIYPLKAFPELPKCDFAAAKELRLARLMDAPHLLQGGVHPDALGEVFSSGVLVASRASREMFNELKQVARHSSQAEWGEQIWLNILAYHRGFKDRLSGNWIFLKVHGMPPPLDPSAVRYAYMPVESLRPALERLYRGEPELPGYAMPGAQWLTHSEEPWPRRVTFAIAGAGLGDVWRSVEYACHVNATQGCAVELYCRWHGWPGHDFSVSPQTDREPLAREVLASLETRGQIRIVQEPNLANMVWLQWFKTWNVPLVPSRIRWKSWTDGLCRRVAYQLDGNVDAKNKNPPIQDLPLLEKALPGFSWVRLGRGRSVRECLEILADSDLFFGVDSGMMQLAYAVGVPALLLEYRSPPEVILKWHGDRHPVLCSDTRDFFFKLGCFLGLEA